MEEKRCGNCGFFGQTGPAPGFTRRCWNSQAPPPKYRHPNRRACKFWKEVERVAAQ